MYTQVQGVYVTGVFLIFLINQSMYQNMFNKRPVKDHASYPHRIFIGVCGIVDRKQIGFSWQCGPSTMHAVPTTMAPEYNNTKYPVFAGIENTTFKSRHFKHRDNVNNKYDQYLSDANLCYY